MSISSLIVHTRPGAADSVRDRLSRLDGVEVHAVTENGRLVVTVDQPDDAKASETFLTFEALEGVLSTSLVFNYFEQDPTEKEQAR